MGAGAGIGTGIAARLAEAGAHVAVHYHRSDEGARAVVERIAGSGGTARAYRADLTQVDEVTDLCERVVADLREKVQATDAEVVQEPTLQPYGLRDCAFRDPAGNLVRIQELR